MARIIGINLAIRKMKNRADAFSGRNPKIYTGISQDVKGAINRNAASVYDKSPAKAMAIKSADLWQFIDRIKYLPIMSTDYANYKQYGCGGLDIVKLVVFNPADKAKIAGRFSTAFEGR